MTLALWLQSIVAAYHTQSIHLTVDTGVAPCRSLAFSHLIVSEPANILPH